MKKINEIAKTISLLKQYRNLVAPEEKLLRQILNRLQNEKQITEEKLNRYSLEREIKGRLSIKDIILNQIRNLMELKWKLVILLIIVAGILVYYQWGLNHDYIIGVNNEKITLPQATGEISQLSQSLIQDAETETALLNSQNNIYLIETDSSMMGEFGQLYNENEL